MENSFVGQREIVPDLCDSRSPRSGGAGGGCVSARPKPKPQKPKLPPLLPLYPQRRPRPLPFMNFSKKTAPA